jgi:putative transposase
MLNLKPQTQMKMEDDVPFEIPEEQLKKMKTQVELEAYISKLYKHAVQTMLKAEMDEHLGYKKHDPVGNHTGNSRNGSSGKTLKTDIGDIPLDVPRDRNSSFDPVIVPKHQRMSARIEQAIITMYSKGMSTRDIEDTVLDI